MTDLEVILHFVSKKKNKFVLYYIFIIAVIQAIGISYVLINNYPMEGIFLVFWITISIGTPTFFGINRNIKKFKFTGDFVILRKSGLTKCIRNSDEELSATNFERIILDYSGFDEGSFGNANYESAGWRGNGNFLKIFYKDGLSDSFEFYIETERDSILLKNILVYHEQFIDVKFNFLRSRKKNVKKN